MTNPQTIADAYLALWNEPDAARRNARVRECWSEDARYVDPMMRGEGHDGIAQMIGAARTQFPGHSFTLAGTPNGHAEYVRFSWLLAPDGQSPIVGGTDIARITPDGRIAEVVGFLDPVS